PTSAKTGQIWGTRHFLPVQRGEGSALFCGSLKQGIMWLWQCQRKTRISCTLHWTRPRMRLSLRKAARSVPEPPTCTGNPGKRVIRVETLSRSAKALLPPHKCGGSHHQFRTSLAESSPARSPDYSKPLQADFTK